MLVLGIDPAPAKESLLFDGKHFLRFYPKELKAYLQDLQKQELLFISWDAPLSAALDEEHFSLTIRPIERFFNRLGRHAKLLGIAEGITTLGFASCPHWTLSQYIFGYPKINTTLQKDGDFMLLMQNNKPLEECHYITEIHPALSMWILLRKQLREDELFKASWKYKGDTKKETKRRREKLSFEMFRLAQDDFVLPDRVQIESDDELDAFVCWYIAKLYLEKKGAAMIYGDEKCGSFLLPYDAEILKSLQSYLKS